MFQLWMLLNGLEIVHSIRELPLSRFRVPIVAAGNYLQLVH